MLGRRGLIALSGLAATVLVACPAVDPRGIQSLGGLSGEASGSTSIAGVVGPVRTRVTSATLTERGSGAFLFKADAEIEVTDAGGKAIVGLGKQYFRIFLSPMPADTQGALEVGVPTPSPSPGPTQNPASSPTPGPQSVPPGATGGPVGYQVQLNPADLARLPALLGGIDEFAEPTPGQYKVKLTFRRPSSSPSLSYAIPSDWKVSLVAQVSDDFEAGKVANWDEIMLGAATDGVRAEVGGAIPAIGAKPYPIGTPGPAPTFSGFPTDAKLTGRVSLGYYSEKGGAYGWVVGYRTMDGATASVVAFPDYWGNFYFKSPAAGQYQFVLEGALQGRGGYQAVPKPDVALPLPSPAYPSTPTPVALAAKPGMPTPTPAPTPAPILVSTPASSSGGLIVGYPTYRLPNTPELYVSEPVTSPPDALTKPQVEIDVMLLPLNAGTSYIRTSSERFVNFAIGYGTQYAPPGATPKVPPPTEFQIVIADASGSILASTATTSNTPAYWDLKDASSSLLPAGTYYARLRYWKAGGSFGGPNFYGQTYPNPLILY